LEKKLLTFPQLKTELKIINTCRDVVSYHTEATILEHQVQKVRSG
jgi:hypothetical protein